MQKHVNLVDLVKSFPTNIYLQNLASIQKRTSPVKFAHLAEKSGNGSISNLSTKVRALPALLPPKPLDAKTDGADAWIKSAQAMFRLERACGGVGGSIQREVRELRYGGAV